MTALQLLVLLLAVAALAYAALRFRARGRQHATQHRQHQQERQERQVAPADLPDVYPLPGPWVGKPRQEPPA